MIFDNIKKYADKKGWSISKVERMAQLPNGIIGKGGDTWNPTYATMKKIADVLEVTLNDLAEE